MSIFVACFLKAKAFCLEPITSPVGKFSLELKAFDSLPAISRL